jgi:Phosphotransferase enzyme family
MPTLTDPVDFASNSFVRHAFELAWLDAEPDPLANLVSHAASQFDANDRTSRNWTRSYSNFSPAREAFCVLVYQTDSNPRHICLVELFVAPPNTMAHTECSVVDTPVGWAKISPLINDPALSTLTSVLKFYPRHEVLRYRPYRRCTLRVQVSDHASQIVKVFMDNQGATVNENTLATWQAKQRGELSFNVAMPLGWDAHSRTLSLGLVPGVPIVDALHGAQGAALSERMGRACAEIALSSIKPNSVFDAAAQMARTREYAQELEILLPQISNRVEDFLGRLAALHQASGQNPLRPIHGSPHAHQWLLFDKVLGLVDFDRFGLGDPELDVATFLGEMDFERHDDALTVAKAFQQGYQAVYGALNPQLITAYRAHKRFAKVRRAAYKPSPKAPDKVLRHLVRAEACLDTK